MTDAPMNRVLLSALPTLVLTAALSACGDTGSTAAPTSESPEAVQTTTERPSAPAGPPPMPQPAADGDCPYLDSDYVAQANGQLVRKVRLSADQPTPACFFYANATEVQLSVWVFQGEEATAKAVVDRAAPVADSSPASVPAGWQGGSLVGEQGAVYAVAKGGAAVVVTSNQRQTIKAREVASTAIEELGL
ncbi:hypothetical protein JOF41_006147 [Saccharothrix coeruleofusca]|uniref:DUF2020 domain-containing protein n=1 Tax=Saccharothrix coeruleofusca TaxID=33919 RepID=UPI0027DC419A|nr:DUF2020 domain-containing protein [Saccharothrix coeruleofusca]MBP2339969.1 hypothetical protein [Saccharothrix coeruleofusca]